MENSGIKTFISYSSKQKTLGGKFTSYLRNYCGYETFIAHDDMPPSAIFEEEIIRAIEEADFFIPLISEDFKTSNFTDQETGIAVNLKKKIIPIKLEAINPYGFISKYHALQYKEYPPSYYLRETDNIKELVFMISRIGLSYDIQSPYHQKAINSILYAFCKSKSFDSANATIKIISNYNHFTSSHLKQIVQAIKTNDQITGAWGLEELKEFLLGTYKIGID
jgi:hypothetical protein